MHLHTVCKKEFADTVTPVGIYLRLRDKYPNSILLESSEYHSRDNAFSYICCDPIASFMVSEGKVRTRFPGNERTTTLGNDTSVPELLAQFIASFRTTQSGVHPDQRNHISHGVFGYTCYQGVQYFEDIRLTAPVAPVTAIPDIRYAFYKYVIVVDHFRSEMYLYGHFQENDDTTTQLDHLLALIRHQDTPSFSFEPVKGEIPATTDTAYLDIVDKALAHCRRGDVFQIVLSRRFSQAFTGDDFNVYRALRAVNPSPYLFYFDYGDFRLFGSSPEAQLVVRDGFAQIHPIAGTFRRTGNADSDAREAERLKADPKENAEHVMLVDLARNDLNRHTEDVSVETFAEIQFYSHVIHLVSKVHGKVGNAPVTRLFADTFPAGTLSGAPKHKAMQLIDQYESVQRSFYGGAIGFIGLDGALNHAIMIRTFCSKNNTLTYQAGAGIVESSKPEKELEEIQHKTAALRSAIQRASTL